MALGLAAASNSDMEFHDLVNAINDALSSGRPLQFVLEVIRLAAGLGVQFGDAESAAAYRQLAAQCQAAEDDMRSRDHWRSDGDPAREN
ncbi:hypothetical protein [Mycobacterium parmense]|uniref:hypothetical protein n=1 Tax=Mycobacterium parmense TaxID=185642 RepID=UPI00111C150F|nr:hypothetical protein [Mycobacterium parmense]MCV7349616.1 hypothetical protein [Mycobacterium parmense]